MLTALTILHLFIALILIVFVLLQDSKGDASGLMGGGGGGGNRSVFGAAGASSFLAKATRFLAAMFAVSCIALAYITTSDTDSSVIDSVPTSELQRSEPAPEAATEENLEETSPSETPEDSGDAPAKNP